MRVSNLVLLVVSILVMAMASTIECAGGAKGGEGGGKDVSKRTTRNTGAALTEAADELLAQTLQDAENTKLVSENASSGAPSSEHLARVLQDEEDKKAGVNVCASATEKRAKRKPQLTAKRSHSASDAVVSFWADIIKT